MQHPAVGHTQVSPGLSEDCFPTDVWSRGSPRQSICSLLWSWDFAINRTRMVVNDKGEEHSFGGTALQSSGSNLLGEPQGREWKET